MRLIITADDFGLTPGICSGILRAHTEGIVTSTSVVALGPALTTWTTPLLDSGLDCGAHLALVGEDRPVLSAREIPSLVDRHGRLPLSWRSLLPLLVGGRIDADDIRREFDAQLALLASLEIPISHVNTHQHLHLWPLIGNLLVEATSRIGAQAVRVPDLSGHGPKSVAIHRLSLRLRRHLSADAKVATDTFHGLKEAGGWTEAKLDRALAECEESSRALGADWAEINLHPGADDDPGRERYRWGYAWEHELSLLCSPNARFKVARANLELADYANMVAERAIARA